MFEVCIEKIFHLLCYCSHFRAYARIIPIRNSYTIRYAHPSGFSR